MKNINSSPWLSVVIPIYNAERYLSACINSILKQSFKDFELILVDDGSTDSSPEICRDFQKKDDRVRFFSKENGGCLQTRVFGAEKAQGQYILFCDADDYYSHNKCFQILKDQTRDSDFDFVHFSYSKKFDFSSKKSGPSSDEVVSGEDFYEKDYPLLLCGYHSKARITGNLCNKLYNRDLIKKLPSSENIGKIFMGEDFILNMHLLENINKAKYISDDLYVYRNMVGGTSAYRPNEMQHMDILKSYQSEFLAKWNGKDKAAVVRMHHAETAGWFYTHIQQSLSVLSENEVREMIAEALKIPSIVKAREYLMTNTEHYPEFKLLVAADPELYISEAKKLIANMSFKDKIKQEIKRILPKILR